MFIKFLKNTRCFSTDISLSLEVTPAAMRGEKWFESGLISTSFPLPHFTLEEGPVGAEASIISSSKTEQDGVYQV